MKPKATIKKRVFSLRVPIAINQKLVERAESIGISKTAVILNILNKEFSTEQKEKSTVQ